MPLVLSPDSRITAGVLLLTIVAIEYGGWFLLRVVRCKQPATEFQTAFFRAGHAHAGVLVSLSLVGLLLVDAAHLSGVQAVLARNGIWLAAILMPAGFFLSAAGAASRSRIGSSSCCTWASPRSALASVRSALAYLPPRPA